MAKRATKPAASNPQKRPARSRYYIVRLDVFEGDDTACYLLGADPMWIVLSASPTRGASIIDYGYRSVEEAQEAWPEAVAPAPGLRGHSPTGNVCRPVFSEPWFQAFWRKLKKRRREDE